VTLAIEMAGLNDTTSTSQAFRKKKPQREIVAAGEARLIHKVCLKHLFFIAVLMTNALTKHQAPCSGLGMRRLASTLLRS
jgi:hypothetical protein